MTDLAKDAVIARGLLEKLTCEGTHDRDGTIQKKHSETFGWIMEHDADVDESTLATNARKLYLSWLHSGYGIFHVAGKLGSGKSTLMKLLFKHPETRKQFVDIGRFVTLYRNRNGKERIGFSPWSQNTNSH